MSQLDSGSTLNFNFFTVIGSYGSIMPVSGAGAEGTRAGRTTMYFASVNSTTSIRVLSWPESSTSLTVSTVSGLASSGASTFACPGPGGLDPCTRASLRMQTGWIRDSELGLMWNSSQNGASRPYPYIRTVLLNPTNLAVLSQPDIFNTTNAWLYPAISVNERGHLGGTADFLGGNQLPTIASIIRDDFSPDLATSGWEAYSVAAGTSGTAGRYGDYNGSVAHEKYPKTWLAVGHRQVGGSSDSSSVTHNYWFGRERDNPAPALPRAPADFDGDGVSDWVVYRNGTWFYFGPCAHPLNETGVALNPSCSRCVATVCTADSFCCATSWDSTCVGEAVSLCP